MFRYVRCSTTVTRLGQGRLSLSGPVFIAGFRESLYGVYTVYAQEKEGIVSAAPELRTTSPDGDV